MDTDAEADGDVSAGPQDGGIHVSDGRRRNGVCRLSVVPTTGESLWQFGSENNHGDDRLHVTSSPAVTGGRVSVDRLRAVGSGGSQ